MTINPINHGPTLAITGSDHAILYRRTRADHPNCPKRTRPRRDIITTYYGPVANYPTLTLSASGGTAGITLNGGTTRFPRRRRHKRGNAAPIAYNGTSLNGSGLALKVTDSNSVVSNTVTIPYISLAVNPTTVGFNGTGATYNVPVTVTLRTATAGGTLDSQISSSTTCSPTNVTIVPAITGSTNALTAESTYTLTANTVGFTTCSITLKSVNDQILSLLQ